MLVRAWNRFWFSEFDPFSLAVFRVVLGILFFIMILALWPNWERNFAINGVSSLDLFPNDEGWWSLFRWTEGWISVQFWRPVSLLICLGFIVGFQTRVCTIFLFLLQCSMIHRARMMTNGEDMVFRMLLFYSCFAPLGAELSLDHYFGKTNPKSTLIWPLRLMQLNLLGIYAFSLPIKLKTDPTWLNGEMMYWVLVNDNWSRWPWPDAIYHGYWVKIMTYAAVLSEGLIPILVWFKKTRVPMVLTMIGFHVMISIVLKNVTFFSLSMVCGLICFLPGEWTRNLTRPNQWKIRLELKGSPINK